MTVSNLCCDRCGILLAGPAAGPGQAPGGPGEGPGEVRGGGPGEGPGEGRGQAPRGRGEGPGETSGQAPGGLGEDLGEVAGEVPAAGEDGETLPGPGALAETGVRFSYHPGDPKLRDDSGLLCVGCWTAVAAWLGDSRPRACAVCGVRLRRHGSLYVRRGGDPAQWQLCPPHAADLLNGLRTVEPKLDRATFRLPLDTPDPAS